MIFVNLLLATLAVLPVIESLPEALVPRKAFSFADWIEGIIADPSGDHLTPDEAVAAWRASANEIRAIGALEKRGACNNLLECEAGVPDAVWCINRLASLGASGVECRVDVHVDFCTYGTARIRGQTSGTTPVSSSNCNDIARAGGLIMDRCTRVDGKVQGWELAWGNSDIAVTIMAYDQSRCRA